MLKTSLNKIKSSLGSFKFAVLDLPIIRDNFDKKELLSIENEKNYNQVFDQIILSSASNHIETIKQAFYEWQQRKQIKSDYIDDLLYFLMDLRNAFNHTTGSLVPRWSNEKLNLIKKRYPDKKSVTYTIVIPVSTKDTCTFYNPASKNSIKLKWFMKSNNKIKVRYDYLYRLLLLSYHLLHLVTFKNVESLNQFLEAFTNKDDFIK